MKNLKKMLVMLLALALVFVIARGFSQTAFAEDEEEDWEFFEDGEEFDLEDWEDWELVDLDGWDDFVFEDDYEDGEEEYTTETLADGSELETYTITYSDGSVMVSTYTTSPEGDLLKESVLYTNADGSVYSSETEYTYQDGVCVKGVDVETETYPDSEEENVTKVTEYTYDEWGDALTMTVEYTLGNGTVSKENWTFSYDDDGNPVDSVCVGEETDYDGEQMNWESTESYDEFGNIIAQSTKYSFADGSISSESWTYTYDDDGNCVSGECFASDSYPEEGETTRTVTETYNEDGNVLTQYIEYSYPESED